MKGSAADVLVKYLEQEGISHLFGVPGGHLLSLYDAVHRSGKIKTVLARNEQGAGYMANGYARVSGKPGLCCGTVGPGATNLVSGVATAYMDSTPLIVLTAQVGTTAIGKGALQEAAGDGRTVDQVALFRPITKYSTMVTRPVTVPEAIRKAIRIAVSGRPGPVHLDLPSDVLKGDVDDPIVPPERFRASAQCAPDPDLVARAASDLAGARHPAMLIGGGAVSSGAAPEVLALAEMLGIPVATSLRAKGILPEAHPLSLGCVGLYGTRAANSYLRSGVDVLLAVGVSFHEFTTHVWDPAFQPKNALIQVDIDPAEIGKNYPVDVPLVGDARPILKALLAAVERQPRPSRDGRDAIARFKRESEYFDEPAMSSSAFPLKPQRAMSELRAALPEDAIVFTDIGNNLTWVERCYPAAQAGTMVSMSGLAAMGSGVAGAIGGKIAAPDRPVVCVCGDGDFGMTGMEVTTAVGYGAPVIWVILNNHRLSMIRDIQGLMYQGRYEASDLPNPDFVGLAHALGAEGYRIQGPGELGDVVAKAVSGGRPTIVDVPIDPEELPPMKPRMLALERSLGLPEPTKTISWKAIRAMLGMLKER
ncbi:MAG TPA: thiamine pyrophosphate-binding protein [Chloroflexota bacterium]